MDFALSEELTELQQTVRRLAQDKVKPRAREIDESNEYPEDLFELFRDAGLLGLVIPEHLGGSGAGIVGLSGYLPIAGKTAAERSPANQHTPIFLAHGSHDEVVGLDRAESSRDALQALGYAVEWHQYAMGHSVHPLEIRELNAFLVRVLSAGGTAG